MPNPPSLTRETRFEGRRFVFATMPVGPFSRDLADIIRRGGGDVMRVLSNGGDKFDWGAAEVLQPPPGVDWLDWIEGGLRSWAATDVVTLADVNRYSKGALVAAKALGLRTHVLEQGYLRPNWITYERSGVNANSALPRNPDFYRRLPDPPPFIAPRNIAPIAFPEAFHTTRYFAGVILLRSQFPDYVYPHSFKISEQGWGHTSRYLGRIFKTGLYRRRQKQLIEGGSPFFITLLQREGDSQFRAHSDIANNPALIELVVASFARHAPTSLHLVVRNHPLDPAVFNLARATRESSARYGVDRRVTFLDHTPLGPLLGRAAGVVTINSTAAISAIEFGAPTKLLGRALFNIPGLVDPQGLDEFWSNPAKPDRNLFERFRSHVLRETQIFGNFFNREHMMATAEALADRMHPCGGA